MKKMIILLLLSGLCGMAHAQFQREDEVVTAALNQKLGENLGRHHVSLGFLGYFKSTSGDFIIPEFGIDASEGTGEFLNYRYSFDKNVDLAVDVHGWMNETEALGIKIETTVIGMGLGVRYNLGNVGGRLFPYIQANVYSLTEQIKTGISGWSFDDTSDPVIGLGANGGFEIKLGKLISIPIDGYYLYGKPVDDISGYGFAVGISFNWGAIE